MHLSALLGNGTSLNPWAPRLAPWVLRGWRERIIWVTPQLASCRQGMWLSVSTAPHESARHLVPKPSFHPPPLLWQVYPTHHLASPRVPHATLNPLWDICPLHRGLSIWHSECWNKMPRKKESTQEMLQCFILSNFVWLVLHNSQQIPRHWPWTLLHALGIISNKVQ